MKIGMSRNEWKAAYVARFVESGFSLEDALADYEGREDDHDFTQAPADAADDSMSCCDQE